IALGNAAHAAGRPELAGYDAYRDARPATFAGRPVGDRLATAKAAVGQDIVEFRRALADQMGKHLPFLVPGKIGARRRRRQIELRGIARVLCHGGVGGRYVGLCLPGSSQVPVSITSRESRVSSKPTMTGPRRGRQAALVQKALPIDKTAASRLSAVRPW